MFGLPGGILLVVSVPFQKISRWENVCFSEHEYFKAALVEFEMIYRLCELLESVKNLIKIRTRVHI